MRQGITWALMSINIVGFISISRRALHLPLASAYIVLGTAPGPQLDSRKGLLFSTRSARHDNNGDGVWMKMTTETTKEQDSMMAGTGAISSGSLASLCDITKRACDAVTPMIVAFYNSLDEDEEGHSTTKTVKQDKSAFTIADGTVQHLILNYLFRESGGDGDSDQQSNKGTQCNLRDIVGEEDDCVVTLEEGKPYTVDDLVIPTEFVPVVDKARNDILDLRKELCDNWNNEVYGKLTLFLDPIDGTREFTSKKGEQCSICVGFANEQGLPVAGVVYRPIGKPTWAAGAASEGYVASNLDMSPTLKEGMVTTNGSMSPFMHTFIEKKLQYDRIKAGGAGNKMLMLLENKGTAYISDRGVSRWDTCGAQACLEAHGGVLCKLSVSMNSNGNGNGKEESYTYLASDSNLDFESGVPNLSPQNCAKGLDASSVKGEKATDPAQVKPYANLCGLFALSAAANTPENKQSILRAAHAAAETTPPSFD
jgi:3'-phosphoadenosine 5'-phosphosulfate (PAPS) 3'-phosphatase